MDRVHNPDRFKFISPEIDVASILAEWVGLGTCVDVDHTTNLASTMNISPAIIDELETVCSIDNLTCEDEPTQFLPDNFRKPKNEAIEYVTPSDHNLQCLKIKEAVNAKRANHGSMARQLLNKANRYKFSDPKLIPNITEAEYLSVKGPELLLIITLYQPYRKRPGAKYLRGLEVEQQVVCLGSQKLSDLRDRFACLADISVLDDFSENPDLSILTRAKDIFTSGFFYINGTIYNDMRNPQSRDNSKAITDWANEYPDMLVGPFETKRMEDTRFLDLKLRLGYPYVYQHQGNCEHLLVFQDIRLMNYEDCQDRNKYPIVTSISSRKRVICMVCHLLTAKWVTSGNQRVPADPFFFCDSCFRLFNYDAEGQKIGQFFAQPFADRSAIL